MSGWPIRVTYPPFDYPAARMTDLERRVTILLRIALRSAKLNGMPDEEIMEFVAEINGDTHE